MLLNYSLLLFLRQDDLLLTEQDFAYHYRYAPGGFVTRPRWQTPFLLLAGLVGHTETRREDWAQLRWLQKGFAKRLERVEHPGCSVCFGAFF
jgi:hypothetical protein